MKLRLAVATTLFVTASLFANISFATGSIFCQSSSGASISLQIGFVAVDAIIGAYIEADGKNWSTFQGSDGQGSDGQGSDGQGESSKLSILQGFVASDRILVDFGDENLENIVARLRLFRAEDKAGLATAGTLAIAGVGVYPVICQGP